MWICARKKPTRSGREGRVPRGRRKRSLENRHDPEEEACDWIPREPEDERATRRREREAQVEARVRGNPEPGVPCLGSRERCSGRQCGAHQQDTEDDRCDHRGGIEAEREGRHDQNRRQQRLEHSVDVDRDESQKRHIRD
jgi:hypothetical protein